MHAVSCGCVAERGAERHVTSLCHCVTTLLALLLLLRCCLAMLLLRCCLALATTTQQVKLTEGQHTCECPDFRCALG